MLGIVPGLAEGLDPNEAAHAVFEWMRGEMRYMPGSTGVTTDAEQAWNQREGVCQDLAHLAIGSLRSLGIPARYISGYLHPRSTAGIGATFPRSRASSRAAAAPTSTWQWRSPASPNADWPPLTG